MKNPKIECTITAELKTQVENRMNEIGIKTKSDYIRQLIRNDLNCEDDFKSNVDEIENIVPFGPISMLKVDDIEIGIERRGEMIICSGTETLTTEQYAKFGQLLREFVRP